MTSQLRALNIGITPLNVTHHENSVVHRSDVITEISRVKVVRGAKGVHGDLRPEKFNAIDHQTLRVSILSMYMIYSSV